MNPKAFTTALTTLGLDNHQAAAWLGVSVRAVQRYRVTGAPGPVAGMVRLALKIDNMQSTHSYYEIAPRALALDWRE